MVRWSRAALYFLIFLLVVGPLGLRGEPPRPSVECSSGEGKGGGGEKEGNCRLWNAYGEWNDRMPCEASAVVYPSTEADLLAAVAMAAKLKQKMKTVTRFSHSIPKWACPGGSNGLLISTQNYTHNIIAHKDTNLVTVDSGVILLDLLHHLFTLGLSLPHSPYWAGASIGGLLSTGSHGSSLFGLGSALHEYIASMSLVVPASEAEGFAKVVHLNEGNEALNAGKVSLGVLGVISQVTFKVEPLFKRSITNVMEDDQALDENILSFALAHEFGDITWHPSEYKVLYRKDDRVPMQTSGMGVNDFIGFQAQRPFVLNAVRSTELLFESTRNRPGKCLVAKAQIAYVNAIGTGLKNDNKSFTHYPIVGFQNHIQASASCLLAPSSLVCGWDPRVNGLFFYESAFLLRLQDIAPFIKDVKMLREKNPSRLCGTDLYYGILLRFVKKSSAFLGAIEDSVEVNFNYLRQRDATKARLDEDVWEEIEQLARFKYNGLPSWGKNRDVVFQGMDTLYKQRLTIFRNVMARLDPKGLFSSEWSDTVLGVKRCPTNDFYGGVLWSKPRHFIQQNRSLYNKFGAILSTSVAPFCALDGLCLCFEDNHCDPKQGYFCENGLVYTDAHVCRYTLR